MKCPHCQKEVVEGLSWCSECGERLAADPAEAPPDEDTAARTELESRVDEKIREMTDLDDSGQPFQDFSDAVVNRLTQTTTVYQGADASQVGALITSLIREFRPTDQQWVICPECNDRVRSEDLVSCDECGEPRLCRTCRGRGVFVCRRCLRNAESREVEREVPGLKYSGGFVIAAGRTVRVMDPITLEPSVTCTVPHSPRSVACAEQSGHHVLLAGWRLGLCQLGMADGSVQCEYCVPESAIERTYGTPSPRAGSGFNSIAISGCDIIASHSELGVWRWRAGLPGSGEPLLADRIDPSEARHIGPVRIDGGRVLVATDRVIVAAAPDGRVERILDCAHQDVLDFRVVAGRVVAVTHPDGELVTWPVDDGKMAAVAGTSGPAAALAPLQDGNLVAVGREGALWLLSPGATGVRRLGSAPVGSGEMELAAANGDLLALVTRRADDRRSRLVVWDMHLRRALGAEGGAEGVFGGSIRDIAVWCSDI